MTGRRSKRKGYRLEKACVDILTEWGAGGLPIRAKRGDGTQGEDVYATIGMAEFRVECKARKGGAGFATLLQWIVGSDALWLHADGRDSTLVAMRPKVLQQMLQEAYGAGLVVSLRNANTNYTNGWIEQKDGTAVPREVGGQPVTKAEEK